MSRALPLLALLASCGMPDVTDMFHSVDLSAPEQAAGANQPFVQLIAEAEESVHIAISHVDDTAITDALLAAHERGVLVELVIDGDRATAGTAALEDAGVAVRHADTGVAFFDFSINADVAWSSEQTMMSHNFAVADRARWVASSEAGRTEAGTRIHLQGKGEDLIRDLLTEHNQLMGGVDATALTAFSSPAKSIADARWMYPVDSEINFELWLGPQERVTKRIIDAVYGANASVWVLTDDFANDGLTKALQDKARAGFDVKVVVGPSFGTSNAPLSRELENETPDVAKRRVDDPIVPTLVLIDYLPSPIDGRHREKKAFMLSHDLYAATRLYRGVEITSDQYIDGSLWVMTDYDMPLSPELEALRGVFDAHFTRGGSL